MPHVYILECADGTYYTGSTIDLDRRLAEHQSGEGAVYTRKRHTVYSAHERPVATNPPAN